MSLEQYKDASRKELWDILQIQMQVLQAETARVAELEDMLAGRTKVARWIERFDMAVGKQQHIIEAQKVKIAELEKELSSIVAGLFSENELAIRDLEQQAKGVEGYIDRRKLAGGSYCSTTLMYIDELYEQAKALKEQVK